MTPKMYFLLASLIIGSWFLMGGKRSSGEKLGLLIVIIVFYVVFRLMSGSSLEEILAPLRYLSDSPSP